MTTSASPAAPPLRARFDRFEIDEAEARLLAGDEPLHLAPKPFALLCALVRAPRTLITKNALLDAVWGHQFVSESVLKTTISDLRSALQDDPKQPRSEREFVHRVRELHPHSAKPAIIGNCQAGWAAMMLAAAHPDDTGPLVIVGAPMSYWGGDRARAEGNVDADRPRLQALRRARPGKFRFDVGDRPQVGMSAGAATCRKSSRG